jgi:23S rRNA (pseudouridine1915-N3)-methyltransferase
MKLRICAVGRMKAGAERELAEDYLKRARSLGKQVGITGIEVADAAETVHDQAHVRIARDAETLAGLYPAGTPTVVLDGKGKTLSTEQFTEFLRHRLETGASQLAFLIGGPDGHAAQTLQAAELVLSFGPMTWPHRLVRVMLAEQIYRTVTIMVNHPYHRS